MGHIHYVLSPGWFLLLFQKGFDFFEVERWGWRSFAAAFASLSAVSFGQCCLFHSHLYTEVTLTAPPPPPPPPRLIMSSHSSSVSSSRFHLWTIPFLFSPSFTTHTKRKKKLKGEHEFKTIFQKQSISRCVYKHRSFVRLTPQRQDLSAATLASKSTPGIGTLLSPEKRHVYEVNSFTTKVANRQGNYCSWIRPLLEVSFVCQSPTVKYILYVWVSVCVYAHAHTIVHVLCGWVWMSVCVCMWEMERERESAHLQWSACTALSLRSVISQQYSFMKQTNEQKEKQNMIYACAYSQQLAKKTFKKCCTEI